MSRTRLVLLEVLLVFIAASLLIGPKFRMKYMHNWGSIDATFISDGRFLAENWPHPQWQPLWYGGTRFDYIYPPGLRYATAGLTKVFPIIPARAYHLFTAIMFAFGIAGVWLLVRFASQSRTAAWIAAFATAAVSPSFLFLKHIRADSYHQFPQRLNALVRYGEGPHMSSLAILGPTFLAAFYALRGGHPVLFGLAAAGAAWAVSTNFYGATALAMFFPMLCWAVFLTQRDWKVWMRAAGIAALAYGLTAVWLSPSFLAITARNLHYVSQPATPGSLPLFLVSLIAVGAVSWAWAKGDATKAYAVFVGGSLSLFCLNVLGNYYWNFRLFGEPERMVPELDLVMILAMTESLRRIWTANPKRWLKPLLTVLAVAASLYFGRYFLLKPWAYYVRDDYTQRQEYRISKWVHENIPGQKCMATATTRFWWNAWYSEAEAGGGSEQGLENPNNMVMQWETLLGNDPERDLLWYKAFAIDCVIVHEPGSEQMYIDFGFPYKYKDKLPMIWTEGKFDKIYRVPRRFQSLARVVERSKADALKPVRQNGDLENLRAYAEMAENGPDRPTTSTWVTTDHLRITAPVETNQAVLVQATYDVAWHAYSSGKALPIHQDPLGQMIIDTPTGNHTIDLVFETPVENQAGKAITLASCGLVGLLLLSPLRRKRA